MSTTLSVPTTFAELIRQRRMERGWTQVELSYEARVPQTTISRIEAGRKDPTLDVLKKLCRALEVDQVPLDLLWDKRRYRGVLGHRGVSAA